MSNDAAPSPAPSGREPITLLDCAEVVLAESQYPMRVGPIVNEIVARGLWSPSGKTPQSTLHGLISRDIARKGDRSRFQKVDRGFYGLSSREY